MDFTLNINHDGDINILQITDMQLIDANQRRSPDRIDGWKLTEWVPEKNDKNIYSHIKYLVEQSHPDLILVTGDIIYGEFDDKGSSFAEFIEFMDSLRIPWAPVFGNHDNESRIGVDKQCEMLENSEYALFKRGNIYGNGNYTIGIYRNGILCRGIFMVDSNGCDMNNIKREIHSEQLAWIKETAQNVHAENADIPFFLCCHIPTQDFLDAYYAAGYQTEKDEGWWENFHSFEIGKDVPAKNDDFGKKAEGFFPIPQVLLPILKECNIDGFFVGHCHVINTSVMYEGIRFTFGLKTGYYDYYAEDSLGGTLIRLDDKSFSVKHIHYVPEV